ncbi:PLC-like phosphodiesterase, partial [Boeremia exigua]|uniref:PLC-like phosphodiesterase n=1 Tax=Boeremia exigua TaxID=749465 RepID=UPI001E8E397C
MNSTPRYRDNEEDPIEDQLELSAHDMSTTHPQWYRSGPQRLWHGCLNYWPSSKSPMDRKRRRLLCRRVMIFIVVTTILGVISALVYLALVSALLRRLNPPPGRSGLHHIIDHWREPDDSGTHIYEWRDDFSRDIVPKNCHSHNDYWRSVPLYNALAAGCIGIEADIWLADDNELLVSHSWASTTLHRTLRSLYLDPLANVLDKRNATAASEDRKEVGVFDADPTVSTILLIDFKNDEFKTWPVLLEQLRPFQDRDWLTYYDGSVLHQGPLTIVGTGSTPFELVQQNSTNRIIFFDAPLLSISDEQYNTTNSYYASVEMKKAIGSIWFNKLSAKQVDKLTEQIRAADAKGLKSRYWGEPRWPISLRDKVWFKLTELGVGMLNVDDLVSATRWNWNWCIIAGLRLCGNS